jgi:hypothetical protein
LDILKLGRRLVRQPDGGRGRLESLGREQFRSTRGRRPSFNRADHHALRPSSSTERATRGDKRELFASLGGDFGFLRQFHFRSVPGLRPLWVTPNGEELVLRIFN